MTREERDGGPDLRQACADCWVLRHPAIWRTPDTSVYPWSTGYGRGTKQEPTEAMTDLHASDGSQYAGTKGLPRGYILTVGVRVPPPDDSGRSWTERTETQARQCRSEERPVDAVIEIAAGRLACPGGLFLVDRMKAVCGPGENPFDRQLGPLS